MMSQRNQESDSRRQNTAYRIENTGVGEEKSRPYVLYPAFCNLACRYLLSDFSFRAVALLLFASGAASTLHASYAFEFTCRGDTVQQVQPGAVAEFDFTLANTGTEPDAYEFDCRVMQSVPSWYVTYCVGFR